MAAVVGNNPFEYPSSLQTELRLSTFLSYKNGALRLRTVLCCPVGVDRDDRETEPPRIAPRGEGVSYAGHLGEQRCPEDDEPLS